MYHTHTQRYTKKIVYWQRPSIVDVIFFLYVSFSRKSGMNGMEWNAKQFCSLWRRIFGNVYDGNHNSIYWCRYLMDANTVTFMSCHTNPCIKKRILIKISIAHFCGVEKDLIYLHFILRRKGRKNNGKKGGNQQSKFNNKSMIFRKFHQQNAKPSKLHRNR